MPRLVHRNSGAVAGKKLAAHCVHDQGLAAALVDDLQLHRGWASGQSLVPLRGRANEGVDRERPGRGLYSAWLQPDSLQVATKANTTAHGATAMYSHLIDGQSKDDGHDSRQDLARIMRHKGQSTQSRNSSSLHSIR